MKIHNIVIFCVLLCLFIPLTTAELSAWSNSPKTGTEAGETFEIRVEILSNETTNYTVIIQENEKFSVIDNNYSKTHLIPNEETRTFIFQMSINEKLDDGKHLILYQALKEDGVFKEGKIYVRAGKQVPGFEFIYMFVALAIIVALIKKRS